MTHNDPVYRPRHYTAHPSGVECIDVARHMTFAGGNALKYVWRHNLNAGRQDLEKARFYLCDAIDRRDRLFVNYIKAAHGLHAVIPHEHGPRRLFFRAMLALDPQAARNAVDELLNGDDDYPIGQVTA